MADLNMPDREHGPALAIMSEAMKPHPAAEMFPLIAGIDFDALVADIRDNGQRVPIVIYDNMILDGRHRYKACLQLGIEPAVIEWNGKGTPEFFVLSMNLHRRHLSESQRATIAAKIATRPPHRQKDKAANLPPSQAEAAEMLNVSERSVRNAATVIAKGSPEMVQALERGDIKAYAAAQLVNLSKARQKEIVAAGARWQPGKRRRQQRRRPSSSKSSRRLRLPPCRWRRPRATFAASQMTLNSRPRPRRPPATSKSSEMSESP